MRWRNTDFMSAWWNVNTHKAASVLEITLAKQRSTQSEMFVWMSRIRRVPGASIEGSNPSALTTFAVSTPEGRGETETVRAMRVTRMTDAPKGWQCTASRYQARPDCLISPRSAGFVEGPVRRTSRNCDGTLEPGRGGRNAPSMRDSRRDGWNLQRMVCREILQRVTRM